VSWVVWTCGEHGTCWCAWEDEDEWGWGINEGETHDEADYQYDKKGGEERESALQMLYFQSLYSFYTL
jgi:hypothetical protein